MLLPNQCSYASHQRIHQHKSPYTCPECGAICRSVHFQTHVTKSCLHYTRRVGFRSVCRSLLCKSFTDNCTTIWRACAHTAFSGLPGHMYSNTQILWELSSFVVESDPFESKFDVMLALPVHTDEAKWVILLSKCAHYGAWPWLTAFVTLPPPLHVCFCIPVFILCRNTMHL